MQQQKMKYKRHAWCSLATVDIQVFYKHLWKHVPTRHTAHTSALLKVVGAAKHEHFKTDTGSS